ncbi:MAG: molybdenum cofactor biosynthesis protein MoaE [Alcaligenaceae bacterium]|nr:molybdenum cofactor biosynthesis protein MoaE [Alcaligenaceae bacterium]
MHSISIQEDDFNLDKEIRQAEASAANAGAIVSFTGRVRGHDHEKPLSHLFLEYFPEVTEAEIEKIILQAKAQWPILYVRVIHRVGRLDVGENIVLVLTASEHRKAAYQANEFIMDYLKTRAPFWKKEHFADGNSHWVEMKQSDVEHTESWQN